MQLDKTYAVLWDMDGVLVDSGEFHYVAWVEILAREGLPYTRAQFNAMFGMDNRGVLNTLLGREPEADWLAQVSDEKEAAFRAAIVGKAQPLPGVVRWLTRLKAAGVRQAVASSAPPANIDLLIDTVDLRQYFDAVVSTFGMAGKPDPGVFLEAARQVGVPPERCLVVEDAIAGVQAAKRAGMACLAVTNTNTRAALAAAQADAVVDSLEQVDDHALERLLTQGSARGGMEAGTRNPGSHNA
jgi:HAD superfamily hydrolase (TIGR01509 family)